MEIPEKKMALNLDSYIQGKTPAARGKSEPHEVSKKTGENPKPSGAGKRTGPVDRVNISERARDIQKARAELDKAPEVRKEKVEKLKAAISEGTYRVDGKEIANEMLKEHLRDLIL
jgi:negative regulator of flagellin synthesis FlgM